MATAQEIRDAADTLLTARTTQASANQAFGAADAAAIATCSTEQAALAAAANVFEAALETARQDPGWQSANAGLLAANQALTAAENAFAAAAASYDGQ